MPLAELTNITIDNNTIFVGNTHTVYFNEKKRERVDLNDLLAQYKDVVKTAKRKGVKVGYTRGFKRRIEALKDSYPDIYEEYRQRFFELKMLVENKVRRGITLPTSDDVDLPIIYEKRNALQAMFYGNQPMSEASTLAYEIAKARQALNNDSLVSIRL